MKQPSYCITNSIEYKTKHMKEIILKNKYHGYTYYIVDYGTHPCAYVEISKNNVLYEKDYLDDDYPYILVHGGITFTGSDLHNFIHNSWIIGWDYNHWGDYDSMVVAHQKDIGDGYKYEGKKWTTEEIIKDCELVIRQVICINKEGNWNESKQMGHIEY